MFKDRPNVTQGRPGNAVFFIQKMCFPSARSVILQDAVLSQGEPRDAAVNFDTYRILQRHRAVSLP